MVKNFCNHGRGRLLKNHITTHRLKPQHTHETIDKLTYSICTQFRNRGRGRTQRWVCGLYFVVGRYQFLIEIAWPCYTYLVGPDPFFVFSYRGRFN